MEAKSIALLFFLFVAFACTAQKPDQNLKEGLAIQGYDPVSYFNGKPMEGKKELSKQYKGATYRFATAQNRDEFAKSPDKYAPEYGGWCAYAMAEGDKVSIDPETYKIIDGKLYLFYHTLFSNTLKKWNEDESDLHQKANAAWQKIHNN
ncbi:YHS domain-containing (seleno)protein [Persicitalea sp.]|uniref:YHS domain-containing (seleno)protein n=1 Tax=Persicitalea sp. TaxID=3100273 RepID=UPI0035939071